MNMKKRLHVVLAVVVVLVLIAGTALLAARYLVLTPVQRFPAPAVVDIPPGFSSTEIVDLLVENDVIAHRTLALAYLFFSDYRGTLQAGEYVFEGPVSIDGVFDKMARGDVRLYRFTVPEGLRFDQVAARWESEDFGTASEFLSAAAAAMDRVLAIDPQAVSIEGYLFPETYSFRRGVTAAEAVDAMLDGFVATIERIESEVPLEEWPLDLHQTLTMASLIESEAQIADERGLVSSVFYNRLERGMRLECDPTIIYALVLEGEYTGRILRRDLSFDSPYNTYVYGGLPPGPISNPGFAALRAAIAPAMTDYVFFVRTEGGRHTFSRTLAEHNRAVAEYRRMEQEAR